MPEYRGGVPLRQRPGVESPALLGFGECSVDSLQGLIWQSRQAELAGHAPTEVLILFGDAFPSGRGLWPLTGPGIRNLFDGPGRLLIDQIAEDLDALVEPGN